MRGSRATRGTRRRLLQRLQLLGCRRTRDFDWRNTALVQWQLGIGIRSRRRTVGDWRAAYDHWSPLKNLHKKAQKPRAFGMRHSQARFCPCAAIDLKS
jgi:hypothetical protein